MLLEDMQRIGVIGYISQIDRQNLNITEQIALALATVTGDDYDELDAEAQAAVRNRFSVYDMYCAADMCDVRMRVEWLPREEGAWHCDTHRGPSEPVCATQAVPKGEYEDAE